MHIQIDYYVLSSYHTHREYFLVYGMFIFQLAYPKTLDYYPCFAWSCFDTTNPSIH